MLAWLLLLALTALGAVAALGVTVRTEPEGRAEAGVLATAVFYAVIVTPVMVLGYLGWLRPAALAASSLVTSSATLYLSSRGRSLREHAGDIRRLAAGLGRLPRDAFGLAVGARSWVTLGLAGAALAIGASAWLTYLAPSESWDGFFYHEPMVGLALQNHGFSVVPLPLWHMVQPINGYPRLCEAFALWFVIFTDKTLIEIGNTLAAPGLMLGAYVLARRYTSDPLPAMGWAAVLLLMPGMLTQLRTSMNDVQVAFFLVAAIGYVTRPALRLRDALAAFLCLALLMGSKGSGLVWVPLLALVMSVRMLVGPGRAQLGRTLAILAGAAVVLAGVGALTVVRNWTAFHNPVWPVSFSYAPLHAEWPGLISLAEAAPDLPLAELVAKKYHFPTGGVGDIIARDYGYGVPWILVPLAAVALGALTVAAFRRRDPRVKHLVLLVAVGVALAKVSPSVAIARYNAHLVAIAAAATCWLLDRATRLQEGALAAALVLTLVPWVWTDWFFGVDLRFQDLVELHRHSATERATMNVAKFQMPPAVARARERDLGRGDLVVFTQETQFPGVLWNHRMTNRVEYLPFQDAAPFLARLGELGPKWVVVGARSAGRLALEQQPAAWELVGVATRQDGTVAYRRR